MYFWNPKFKNLKFSQLKNLKLKKIETYRQTGVIAFTKKTLLKYYRLKKNYLEKYESIDMLRIIENGYKIQTAEINSDCIAVDCPEDLKRIDEKFFS